MSVGAHGSVCACSMCRRERVALERLARQTVREAVRGAEAEAATASSQPLPGVTVVWGAPVRLSGSTKDEARRSVRSIAGLRQNRCLYRIALNGSDVYVGMAPVSTVDQRLDRHLRSATPSGSGARLPRGDERRLHRLLGQALSRRQPITVRIGRVMASAFYGDLAGNRRHDHKLLHAFEILAGFDLLARRPPATTAYDPSTWTFEQEDAAEERA
jgi:hypothetical protein